MPLHPHMLHVLQPGPASVHASTAQCCCDTKRSRERARRLSCRPPNATASMHPTYEQGNSRPSCTKEYALPASGRAALKHSPMQLRPRMLHRLPPGPASVHASTTQGCCDTKRPRERARRLSRQPLPYNAHVTSLATGPCTLTSRVPKWPRNKRYCYTARHPLFPPATDRPCDVPFSQARR